MSKWIPRTWADDHPEHDGMTTIMAPCCGAKVAPKSVHNVTAIPQVTRDKVRVAHKAQAQHDKQEKQKNKANPSTEVYMCPGCRETLFREGHLDKVAYVTLQGAPKKDRDEITAKLNAKDANGDPKHPMNK